MKTVTLQEVFDRVATHLLTQNAPSTNSDGSKCMYRSPDGLMCAVGCLIPDELYLKEMDSDVFDVAENSSIPYLVAKYQLENLFDFKVSDCDDVLFVDFLSELQLIHDRFHADDWKIRLQMLARRCDLEFPVV